jgi:hypothetical protein
MTQRSAPDTRLAPAVAPAGYVERSARELPFAPAFDLLGAAALGVGRRAPNPLEAP